MPRPLDPALQRLLQLPADERRLGSFRLIKELDRGGFAPVWLAKEELGGTELRTVAVKLFALDASGRSTGGSGSTGESSRQARIIEGLLGSSVRRRERRDGTHAQAFHARDAAIGDLRKTVDMPPAPIHRSSVTPVAFPELSTSSMGSWTMSRSSSSLELRPIRSASILHRQHDRSTSTGWPQRPVASSNAGSGAPRLANAVSARLLRD